MGSAHGPNTSAARDIVACAPRLPGIDFVLIGSVGDAFERADLPSNVVVRGVVTDAEKALWMELAHFGLNPTLCGSGTNLKLAEYAAAGTLIVSSAFGTRGTDFEPGLHYIPIGAGGLEAALESSSQLDADAAGRLIERAHQYIIEKGDWRHIAADYANALRAVL
jgi:glycosyltransferase involved in cell wall biosynthesis